MTANQSQTPAAFTRLIREALAHLYDHLYLQNQELADLLLPDAADDGGRSLHRLLVEAVERLRPPASTPSSDAAWRPYLALHLRYVEGGDVQHVAAELGISTRQLRREHARGLDAVAGQLWAMHLTGLSSTADPVAGPDHFLDGDLVGEIAWLGSESAQPHAARIDQTLRGVLDTLSDFLAIRAVSVEIELPAMLPLVGVERAILRQIFLNTITHCLDYVDAGPLHISGGKGDEVVWIEMGGLKQCDDAEADDGPRRDERLAVARRLLDICGGSLAVPDQAKCLRLILPTHAAPTILIVDDNPDVLQLFRRYLMDSAYEVATADNGDDAARLAHELTPDVVVVDVMMPGQDGWELLQRLKNHPETSSIPVIVCSVLREQALATTLGASGFMTKPVTQQALLRELSRCTSRPALPMHPGLPE